MIVDPIIETQRIQPLLAPGARRRALAFGFAAVACSFALASGCSSNGSDKSGVGSAGTSPVLSNDGTGPGDVFNTSDMQSGTGSLLDPTDTCVGEEAGTELAPAVVELLIDTSLSMDENAPGSRRSKWEETRDAMLSAIALMPATTALGVVFYPNVDVGEMPCFNSSAQVPIAPLGADGSAQRTALSAAFQAQSPNGSTPTHDAYRYALSQLGAATSPGQKYLVLATDGVPTYALNCKGSGTEQAPADPTPLIPEAASALGRGIKTFVIGSPGSENARQSLSQMAQAGGSASTGCSNGGPNYCHFDMTQKPDFGSALRDALAQISGLALSCAYDIPPPPNGGTLDLTKVNVLYTAPGGMPELIGQNPTGACSDGWAYSSDNSQVVLCGNTCDRVKSSSGQVSLQFGCTTQQSIR